MFITKENVAQSIEQLLSTFLALSHFSSPFFGLWGEISL
jgi:hypothetical protein